jgi:hypothetical protein
MDIKKQINKIKKSRMYLSAEATLPNEDESIKIANELLVSEINDWVKSKRNSDEVKQIVLQDISSCTDKINMKRGTSVRTFVYVKKSDIVLIKGEGQIILTSNETGDDLQALADISDPIKIENEKITSPNEPAAVVAADEESVEQIEPNYPKITINDLVEIKTMKEMKIAFADLKAKSAINYGTYPSEGLPHNYFLLFYTRTGEIKTIVSVEGDSLSDLNNHQKVKLSDYSGNGVYWFELK